MGSFFKSLLASCLGTLIALSVLIFGGIMIVGQIASAAEKPTTVKSNTVLHIKLDQPVPERTNNLEMNPFDLSNQRILGLQEIVTTLEKAKEDADIKGIFLEMNNLSMGQSTASVLRDAILDFKESDKFIYTYSDYYSQGAYYMASAADQIYISPLGFVDFKGFSSMIPFFKGMLDKIGVEMQVIMVGNFKSATEPYRLTEMSDENRLQVREFLEGLYQLFLEDIGASRNLSVSELRAIANEMAVRRADDAVAVGLIDKVGHRDEIFSSIRTQLGLKMDEKIPFISLNDYAKSTGSGKDYSAKDKIAVIYAEGNILSGKTDPGAIGDYEYTRMIRKIRQDKRVQAIVLRVNSPGGSAIASENIWRELMLAKSNGKPIVVSMGDYAASGGYYLAAAGDTILAEPNTLTGSIGVFSIIPNARELMTDKLGITMDTVKTAKYATGINLYYPLSQDERQALQAMTDQVYQVFLERVAEGRGMSVDQVHEIAQGRVWTGKKAVELGLVDQLGGLDDAIAIAADMAGLEKYRTAEYPAVKDPLQQFLEELQNEEEVRSQLIRSELGEYGAVYEYYNQLKNAKGVQARLPFILHWN
jgi:protease-4